MIGLPMCKLIILSALFVFLLSGCANLGIRQPFANDPLTGGVDAGESLLLHVQLPLGLQRYPSHSKIAEGSRPEGLETLRGYVEQNACTMSFYDRLKAAGWQLRMRQSFGYRAVYVYQKGNELAALAFHRQGMLTIIEIWTGPRLADNSVLAPGHATDDLPAKSLAPEEYGPISSGKYKGTEEKWGIEEHDI